jgi:hypothetical protein
MSHSRSSRSLRAGLVVVASAAALGVPALASAKPVPSPEPPVKPTPTFQPTYTFEAPDINGDFSEWSDDDEVGTANVLSEGTLVEKAAVSMRYDCSAERLNLRVEAVDGVTLPGDAEVHGAILSVAKSTDKTTFTGTSEQVQFEFAGQSPNVIGWEMSIPLPDGNRYVGSVFTETADGIAEFSGALEIACPTGGPMEPAESEPDPLNDGSTEETVAPVKHASKLAHRAGLRAAIRGPKRVRQGQSALYRVRIANRGKHTARRVVSRITVPRGMKIVRVLRAPKSFVVRGRTVRMRFNRINIRRAKTVVVVVKARNRARVGSRRIVVRAKAANLKGQKPARAAKRVRIARGL